MKLTLLIYSVQFIGGNKFSACYLFNKEATFSWLIVLTIVCSDLNKKKSLPVS